MSSWARCPSHVPGGGPPHLSCRAVTLGGTASVLALNVDEAFRLVPHRDAARCSVYLQGKSIERGTGVSARVSYAHGPGPMLCSSMQHRAFRPSHELLGKMPKPRSVASSGRSVYVQGMPAMACAQIALNVDATSCRVTS